VVRVGWKPTVRGGRTCGCLILRRGLTTEVGWLQTVNYFDSRNRAGLSDTHACSPVPPFCSMGRVTDLVGGCERYGDLSTAILRRGRQILYPR